VAGPVGVASGALAAREAAVLSDPPHWGADPTGRFAQRYWDGARWTDHVATASGGAPVFDPVAATALGAAAALSPIRWRAAGYEEPPVEPEPPTLVGDAAPPNRRWRWIVAASAAALLLVGLAAAVLLSGVLNSNSKARASRVPHARAIVPRPSAASATRPGATVPTTAPATAIPDLCGILTSAEISQTTTIPVGPPQPITDGCVWRGPNALSPLFSAQDRETLAGLEGVILFGHPIGANPQSVVCDNGIAGVPAQSAICTARDGSQYAMFVLPSKLVLQISIRTQRAVPNTALTKLAQFAYSHSG
jgi:hypothetical protein